MTNTTESIQSKKQIIKSTGIVGTSQVFTIILQIVRTKIIAVLLGPLGVGLLGIYHNIVDMARNATGLGINFSGVREVAQACATNDEETIAKKALLLKRWAMVTGLVGAISLILLCFPISVFSFNSSDYALPVSCLSVAVFFTSISQSQIALLQGTRNLVSMAKASVIGVLLSIIIVTPIYYFWGTDGMVTAIILMAVSNYILSHFYVSKLKIRRTNMPWKETFFTGKEMVKLGFANAISGIVSTIAMYYVRSFISSNSSIDDVGFFQASWTISNVYLLSVLNAMAADFFPRLSAVNKDNYKVNTLVNEQTEVALLIGSPLIIAMFVFSSLIISILYSAEFSISAMLLNFFVIGSFFKLLSWPICFISGAKGAIKQILISELSWNIVFIAMIWLFWGHFGMKGIGIAYIFSYIYYLIILFVLVNPLSRFRWNDTNIKHIIFYGVALAMTILLSFFTEHSMILGSIIFLIVSVYSYWFLKDIVAIHDLFKKFRS